MRRHPGRGGVEDRGEDLRVLSTAPGRDMERMIRFGEELQRRAAPERGHRGPQAVELGKQILRPLQKQHGYRDLREVRGALDRGLPCGVKREGEKYQAAHAVERRERLR